MRTNNLVIKLLAAALILILSGCAGVSTRDVSDLSCTTVDINAMLDSGNYQKKINNFIVLEDATSSMTGKAYNSGPSKLAVSKGLIRCMNNSLPDDLGVMAGMRIFGSHSSEEGLVYGMSNYSHQGLEEGVQAVRRTGGRTDLTDSLIDASGDLGQVTGKSAVIIFSDGRTSKNVDPVASAAALKERYGSNVCIYSVIFGDDADGQSILEQIAAQGRCGFAIDAENLYMRPLQECDTLNTGKGMGDFVASVFLEKYQAPEPPKCIEDTDGDGIPDCYDRCPDTPKGIKVDKNGCPIPLKEKVSITLLVEFDFDKAVVKPEFHEEVEKVANFLIAYPDANAELEGHTDWINTDEYNMKLSRSRAESVKRYLVDNFGIDASRITTVGYGESMPIATNETDEGRQKNRRVVANIEAMKE
jgi:OOP family OmpA-OmpF porin